MAGDDLRATGRGVTGLEHDGSPEGHGGPAVYKSNFHAVRTSRPGEAKRRAAPSTRGSGSNHRISTTLPVRSRAAAPARSGLARMRYREVPLARVASRRSTPAHFIDPRVA